MQASQSVPQVRQDGQVQALLDTLFDTVQVRLSQGRPFSDPRAAWMGYEFLCHIAGHAVSLVYHSETKVISLKSNTKIECHQLLPVAVRKARGQYDISLTRPAFDAWCQQFAPVPVVEPDKYLADVGYTDAELAATPTAEYMRIVAQAGQPEAAQPVTPEAAVTDQPPAVRTIWDCLTEALTRPGFTLRTGAEQIIWQSGKRSVSLHCRRSDGLACLVARNGRSPVMSRPIAVKSDGRWRLCYGAERAYQDWQAVVSGKLARTAVEVSPAGGINQCTSTQNKDGEK